MEMAYRISAYGSPFGNGAYVVDTETGEVWHASMAGRMVRCGSVAQSGGAPPPQPEPPLPPLVRGMD